MGNVHQKKGKPVILCKHNFIVNVSTCCIPSWSNCHPGIKKVVFSKQPWMLILLMVQKSGVHQLRLVVYPKGNFRIPFLSKAWKMMWLPKVKRWPQGHHLSKHCLFKSQCFCKVLRCDTAASKPNQVIIFQTPFFRIPESAKAITIIWRGKVNKLMILDPQSLTWNLKMMVSKRNLLFRRADCQVPCLTSGVFVRLASGLWIPSALPTAPRQWWRNPGHPQGRCPLRHQWHGWSVQSKAWNLFKIPKNGQGVSIIKTYRDT